MKPKTRIAVGLFVQLVSLVLALFSWIDPLEGGAAMVAATLVSGVSYAIGRVRIPKLTWISAVVGLAIMAAFWILYIQEVPPDPSQLTTFMPSTGLLLLLWFFRAASIVFMAGAVFYVVVQFMAFRSAGKPQP